MRKVHAQFRDLVSFVTVYVKEAHPTDEWYLPTAGIDVKQHVGLDDRISVARTFGERNPADWPIVVDNMNDQASYCYDAFPEKLLVLEDGVAQFMTSKGPTGYVPAELQAFLAKRFPDAPMPGDDVLAACHAPKVGVDASTVDVTAGRSFVEDAIAAHAVVLFSKTYCQYCKRVKALLRKHNAAPFVVELDVYVLGLGAMPSVMPQCDCSP